MKDEAYSDAVERLKKGERDVEFPEDCFPPAYGIKRGPPKKLEE